MSPWRFCVAPMMDWTDRHCRFFHRLLTRRALLYSYMPEGHWHMRDAERMKKINAEAASVNA